jgi:hypothetical protein
LSNDEREFLDKLRSTSILAATEVMEGLQRLRSFHDEMTEDGSGAPRPRLSDHFYQLAKLELEHAASVLRLGSIQAEMLFDHVRQLARGVRGGQPPMRVLELELERDERPRDQDREREHGRHGHRYVGRFEVRNPFDCRADVRFHISELRGANEHAHACRPTAQCRTNPIPPHASSAIEVVLEEHVHEILFGEIEVYLSAEIEKRVARRALKVRPHGR